MKNLILIFSILLIGKVSFAQSTIPKFELKPNGLVGPDSTKNYIVLEAPKISKLDLYKKTLTYLNSIYNNPSKVITSVEGESIIVNGFTEAVRGPIGFYKYPMSYNINIQFKDGRMKIEPYIVSLAEVWSKNEPERKIYINASDSPERAEINCIFMISNKTGKSFVFNEKLKAGIESWINAYVAGIAKSYSDNW